MMEISLYPFTLSVAKRSRRANVPSTGKGFFMKRDCQGGKPMRISYSRNADVLTIQLREGKPSDSRDIAEGIIVHLSAKGQPLEIEILDASKVVQKKDVEISMEALFSTT